ncbi:MAG: formylglycine-generating enzyme family protein [Verrucomicrobiota bacterium]
MKVTRHFPFVLLRHTTLLELVRVFSSVPILLMGVAANATPHLTSAASGEPIPHPASTNTYPVTNGTRIVQVPATMVYIPGGKLTVGTGVNATNVDLAEYCIGKFHVCNAEYKAFLDATGSSAYPSYWTNGVYPAGKANHPVVYISLTKALAYAAWVSQQTGWKVGLPSGYQWEKAARGPQGYIYPWGDDPGTTYHDGALTTKFNYNAVIAALCLARQPKLPVVYNHQKSKYCGTKTTVDQIAAYDSAGTPTFLSVNANGSVRGWVNHSTYTGFIYTDLFASLNASGGNTTPVGAYEAGKSAYGCYDMAGNVWNWCTSTIVASNGAEKGQTVNEIRGGSWYANGTSCRSISIGEGRQANGAYNTVGFRVVMLP